MAKLTAATEPLQEIVPCSEEHGARSHADERTQHNAPHAVVAGFFSVTDAVSILIRHELSMGRAGGCV